MEGDLPGGPHRRDGTAHEEGRYGVGVQHLAIDVD